MLTVFGAVVQLERDYLKDRQMEGIAIVVTSGKYIGRKPIEYPKLWERYYNIFYMVLLLHNKYFINY